MASEPASKRKKTSSSVVSPALSPTTTTTTGGSNIVTAIAATAATAATNNNNNTVDFGDLFDLKLITTTTTTTNNHNNAVDVRGIVDLTTTTSDDDDDDDDDAVDVRDIVMVKLLNDGAASAVFSLHDLAPALLNTTNRTTFSNIGGVSVLCGIMKKFRMHNRVQLHACRCIQNAYAGGTNPTGLAMARVVGSIETILDAMRRFPNNQELQKNACGALLNLVFVEENAEHFLQIGGLEVLITSMKEHPLNSSLQRYGCWAIYKMSGWIRLQTSFNEHSVFQVLIDANFNYKNKDDLFAKRIVGHAVDTMKRLLG